MLTQTACASLRPDYTYQQNTLNWAKEHARKNAAQYAEWDKKYVSDDVVVVEIFDKNGKFIGHAVAK